MSHQVSSPDGPHCSWMKSSPLGWIGAPSSLSSLRWLPVFSPHLSPPTCLLQLLMGLRLSLLNTTPTPPPRTDSPLSSQSELLNREAKDMSLLWWLSTEIKTGFLSMAYKVLHTPHLILCSPTTLHAPGFCIFIPASGPLHLLLPLLGMLFLSVPKGWLFHLGLN